MNNFFKIFFASLLSLVVFTVLAVFFTAVVIGSMAAGNEPKVKAKTVLILDLGEHFSEQMRQGIFSVINDEDDVPGLYDVVRMLHKAKGDKNIAGIYLKANGNANSFAASEEIRHALVDFKASGKFVLAHGDMMSQQAYSVASAADQVYISPMGRLDWTGYSVDYLFLKGTLNKLEIEPQIFYAGKFKSATEPLRVDKMTEANKLQTTVWINDLYNDLLVKTAAARKTDTATLRRLAETAAIQQPQDAVANKLIDGVKYDDELKDIIKTELSLDKYDKINFMSMHDYRASGSFAKESGEKIALIYAEGDIIDGKGSEGSIGDETYRSLIRKARLDKSIKAIVLRVNSGGGSALASENILRELVLAKKEKPVIVSFGDVAASGGYYIACAADSIFALPTTITGSIGVFGIIPNMEQFYKNKLGVTFDGVQTGPYANTGVTYRPMNDNEKKLVQAEIERIYTQFKQRVSEGRKKDTAFVEEIAQGRVWTGQRAIGIGLIDRFGGLEDAVRAAAAKAKLTDYQVKEYPEPTNLIQQILGNKDPMNYNELVKKQMGAEEYKVFEQLQKVKQLCNKTQTRLPFDFFVH